MKQSVCVGSDEEKKKPNRNETLKEAYIQGTRSVQGEEKSLAKGKETKLDC